MAERNGAAIDVDFTLVDTQRADDVEALRSERFVNLEHIDLIQLDARHAERLRDRFNGADAHNFRLYACQSKRLEGSQRVRPSRSAFAAHDGYRRRAVTRLRRVARGNRAAEGKGRLQLGQHIRCRVRPDPFIRIEGKGFLRTLPCSSAATSVTFTGTISSRNFPSAMAAAALR